MQRSFSHQASAFGLALIMTLSLAAGIQGLATTAAPAEQMAQHGTSSARS